MRAVGSLRTPHHFDDGRWRIQESDSASPHHRRTATEAPYRLGMAGRLVNRGGAFDRKQSPAASAERQGQSGEAVEGCYRPGGYDIGRPPGVLLRPAPTYGHPVAQAQLGDRLLEEGHAPGEWLHQCHGEVGPDQGEDDPRQTGTRAQIKDRSLGRDQVSHDTAVEQMSVPQSGSLSRPDQTSNDPVGGEQFRVPHREWEPLTEDLAGRRLGRLWRRTKLPGRTGLPKQVGLAG